MTSRPVIFISAVSKDLTSARDLVAKVVHLLGYEPKWQDIAPTGQGDLRGVLRKWVEDSHAVIQLVGKSYGAEPREAEQEFRTVLAIRQRQLVPDHRDILAAHERTFGPNDHATDDARKLVARLRGK